MPVPFWAKPSNVALFICAYLVIHFAVRMAMWPTLGLDDAEQALFAQQFAWTYRYRAPPLFTWALVALDRLGRVDIVTISLLRYSLLGITFGCIYLTARRLLTDLRLAALSAYSFVAIYVFAYYSHHDLTHTTTLSAMLALAWYVFVRLAASPGPGWYVALGATVGLGLLAKWNFVMFAAALPLACLLRPGFRQLVLTPKLLLAGGTAAVVVVPSVAAALRMGPVAGEDLRTVLGSQSAHLLRRIGEGSWELLAAVLVYPQPLLVIVLVLFAGPLMRGLRAGARHTGSGPLRPDAGLLGWTMVISIALHWGLVLALGATEFSERLMQPPLLILPVWLFMLIERGLPSDRAINAFALLLAAIAAATLIARVAIYLRGAEHCSTCRSMVPFHELAQEMKSAGFQGGGTVLTKGFHIGGNLRVAFPEARIIDADYPPTAWPEPAGSNQCLLVWPLRDGAGAEIAPAELERYLADELGGDARSPHRDGTAVFPMLNSARRYGLGFRLFDGPVGDCR
jgi:hypothetical protein